MGNKKLLIGSSMAVALAGVFALNPNFNGSEESSYSPRVKTESKTQNSHRGEELYTEMFRPQSNAELLRAKEEVMAMESRATTLNWFERGPDNIGGRTRGIIVDVNNDNTVYAGSVSGGLWVSYDAAQNWSKVESFVDNLSISCIAQSSDGTLVVGTGHTRETTPGDGNIYVYPQGDLSIAPTAFATGSGSVNEAVSHPTQNNLFFIATGNGLKTFDGTTVSAAGGGIGTGSSESVVISSDGNVVVAGDGNKVYTSTDGGANFTLVSSIGAGGVTTSGTKRELAISQEKNSNNKYTVYASVSSSTMIGVYQSKDNGEAGTWTQVAPASNFVGNPPTAPQCTWCPFVSAGGQGNYDHIIAVAPGNDGENAILGGIDVYLREGNNATGYNFSKKSFWGADPFLPYYVHADNHEFKFDSQGNLYIGNDGGIGKSLAGQNFMSFFAPFNRGYNVTQFYNIGYSNYGDVIGGTQDNGSLYNDKTGTTPKEFVEVKGGDGFTCDISTINPDFQIASVYNGGIERSEDKGNTYANFFSTQVQACGEPGATSGGLGSFFTTGRLWETEYDANSTDTIIFVADADTTYYAGDTVKAFSATFNIPYSYVLTSDLNEGDTVSMVDYHQSWYAFGMGNNGGAGFCGGGVWITRDATRASKDPWWWNVGNAEITSTPTDIEFSADGNHMYVATASGQLFRVSGLGTLYANVHSEGYPGNGGLPNGDPLGLPSSVTVTQIGSFPQAVSGIAIDVNDIDHVVVSVGGGSTHVYESNSASTTTGTSSFTVKQGNLPTSLPVYDICIDFSDPNLWIAGTEYGVMITDDGGSTWTPSNEGFGFVRVTAVRQNQKGWSTSNPRPGELYIGTFGRGIWASADLLSVPSQEIPSKPDFVANVKMFPNPAANNSNVQFELFQASDVEINVYSLTGKRVKTIKLDNLGAGTQNVDLNVENLVNGTYILDVIVGDNREVAKFVVRK